MENVVKVKIAIDDNLFEFEGTPEQAHQMYKMFLFGLRELDEREEHKKQLHVMQEQQIQELRQKNLELQQQLQEKEKTHAR